MAAPGIDFTKYYELVPLDGTGETIIVYRGEGAATIASGGGRWDVVQRPKRKSVTLWRGTDPFVMDVPILFDGWETQTPVEPTIARVSQIRFSQADLREPSHLRINGALPVKGTTWVLTDITWGSKVIWDAEGTRYSRYRQDATLHLLQYVSEEAFKGLKEFKIRDRIVVNSSGQGIEHHSGGDPKTKKDIQKKNHIRDPKIVKTKPGKKIVIPYKKNLEYINRGIAGKAYGGILGKIG